MPSNQPVGPSPSVREGRSWRTRLPFYYGWVIVGSVFLSLTLSMGVYYSFSVFFVALLEDFGWDRGPTAAVFSVFVVAMGLGGIASGVLIDRFGPGRVVAGGGVFLSLGLLATSRVSEVWQFYLFYGIVCGIGVGMSAWVPCVTVLSRWFTGRLGLAMGIASAGIGMGTVLVVPLSQYLISGLGWRVGYLILAAAALVGMVPQALLLQVGRPQELGLKLEGTHDAKGPDSSARVERARKLVVVDQKWASRPWSVASAARTAPFWFLFGHLLLASVTNQMLWIHQAAYLVDEGYGKILAASMVGLAGFLSMPIKIFWGNLADRIGRELTFNLGYVAMLVAILLLLLTGAVQAIWLVFLFSVTFAAGYAVTAPISPLAGADIFAGRRFGTIYGVLGVGNGLGGALGAWLAGYIFDVTGSYVAAFTTAAVSCVTSVACLWLAAPRKVRRVSL